MASEANLSDLKLVASFDAWRLYSARQADARFKTYENKVFERDSYTCRYCGFKSKLFQEIVNLDHNFKNNQASNLVTACPFCAQCFFIESVGVGGYGGGVLIYLPELTQVQLNGFCHVLFCSMVNDTGYKTTAQMLYRSLKKRTKEIEMKYGEGTSDPSAFGQLIIDAEIDKERAAKIMKDFRLLPSRAKFNKQIEQWALTGLQDLSGSSQ